jgi:hypothetical protein
MLATEIDTEAWLQMMRAEYLEIPGLSLTKSQAQRLWGLDGPTCDALLDLMVQTRFLRRTENALYVLAETDR